MWFFGNIFCSSSFYGFFSHHANLAFMLMLFAHMLAVEKHTFVYYKKLPEEMKIYKRHLQENNVEIS